MSQAAGKLNRRVSIEAVSEARNGSTGAVTRTWAEIANGGWWVAIEPLSARELIAAGAAQSKVVARITGRYRPDLTAKMRLNHNGKIYNIEGILPDKDTGLEYITIPVSEGVNRGA